MRALRATTRRGRALACQMRPPGKAREVSVYKKVISQATYKEGSRKRGQDGRKRRARATTQERPAQGVDDQQDGAERWKRSWKLRCKGAGGHMSHQRAPRARAVWRREPPPLWDGGWAAAGPERWPPGETSEVRWPSRASL
jgi:hypothetical protein